MSSWESLALPPQKSKLMFASETNMLTVGWCYLAALAVPKEGLNNAVNKY
jgi:hypothetical protein